MLFLLLMEIMERSIPCFIVPSLCSFESLDNNSLFNSSKIPAGVITGCLLIVFSNILYPSSDMNAPGTSCPVQSTTANNCRSSDFASQKNLRLQLPWVWKRQTIEETCVRSLWELVAMIPGWFLHNQYCL